MTALRFTGPALPDGESVEVYVVDGRITYEPQAGAETAASGWLVPGLVDAHCHIGLEEDGAGTDEQAEAQDGDGQLAHRRPPMWIVNVVRPTVMRSPSMSRARETGSPLTYVPLVDPRSRSVATRCGPS